MPPLRINKFPFVSHRSFGYIPRHLPPHTFARVVESITPPRGTFSPHAREASVLEPLLVQRVPGTEGSRRVREYVTSVLTDGQGADEPWKGKWTVEEIKHEEHTPMGKVEMVNVVATWTWPTRESGRERDGEKDRERKLVLGAHHDSKLIPHTPSFLGATDAATSVAILLYLSRVLPPYLNSFSRPLDSLGPLDSLDSTPVSAFHVPSSPSATTLQLVFFDGEESFGEWSTTDGLYGSRHLSRLWSDTQSSPRGRGKKTDLDDIGILVVLDLLGCKGEDERVPCYYDRTRGAWEHLKDTDSRVRTLPRFADTANVDLFSASRLSHDVVYVVEDDHTPFVERGVPAVHLCPSEFPGVWHTDKDDWSAVDEGKCERWAVVVGVWVVEALGLAR